MVSDQIVDHVVTLVGLSKILFCVIDNAIGADRFDKIDIARAANAGDFGAERLGDLDGDSAILRSENFVARFEVRYIFSNCFDDPGEVGAEARVFRLAQPAYWTHRPGASN